MPFLARALRPVNVMRANSYCQACRTRQQHMTPTRFMAVRAVSWLCSTSAAIAWTVHHTPPLPQSACHLCLLFLIGDGCTPLAAIRSRQPTPPPRCLICSVDAMARNGPRLSPRRQATRRIRDAPIAPACSNARTPYPRSRFSRIDAPLGCTPTQRLTYTSESG